MVKFNPTGNYWKRTIGGGLGPPRWCNACIVVQRLVELIPCFAEIPDSGRKIPGVLGDQPRKRFTARVAEVFFGYLGILCQAGGDNAAKKMLAHEFILDNAVKNTALNAVEGVEPAGG